MAHLIPSKKIPAGLPKDLQKDLLRAVKLLKIPPVVQYLSKNYFRINFSDIGLNLFLKYLCILGLIFKGIIPLINFLFNVIEDM